jgi:hypothetical protein
MDPSLLQFHISCAYFHKSSRKKKVLVASIFKLPGNKFLTAHKTITTKHFSPF